MRRCINCGKGKYKAQPRVIFSARYGSYRWPSGWQLRPLPHLLHFRHQHALVLASPTCCNRATVSTPLKTAELATTKPNDALSPLFLPCVMLIMSFAIVQRRRTNDDANASLVFRLSSLVSDTACALAEELDQLGPTHDCSAFYQLFFGKPSLLEAGRADPDYASLAREALDKLF